MSTDATDQVADETPDTPEAETTETAGTETPDDADLEEPSTEKEAGDEPKAKHPDDEAVDHHAVGLGVIDAPDPD